MIPSLVHLTILVNGTLIGCFLLTTTERQKLLYALCALELLLILFVITRRRRRRQFASQRPSSKSRVHRLASLTYSKMEVYYKKTLNNAMCASCKLQFFVLSCLCSSSSSVVVRSFTACCSSAKILS